jgi:hypothetical protein
MKCQLLCFFALRFSAKPKSGISVNGCDSKRFASETGIESGKSRANEFKGPLSQGPAIGGFSEISAGRPT